VREPTTTTTSVSNWSSDMGTSTSATLPADTVTDFCTERKPLKSARSVTRPDGAESWKWPDSSVVAEMLVPSTVTVAPDSGESRSSERIVPETVPVSPVVFGGSAGSLGGGLSFSGCASAGGSLGAGCADATRGPEPPMPATPAQIMERYGNRDC